MNTIYFFGRFHVLALHLPITLLLIVVLMEWLSRREKYRHLQGALPFLWTAAAITAVATVILGYMHFSEGGFTGFSALAHRFFGTCVAAATTGAWLLRRISISIFNKASALIGLVLVALVTITGHFGGNLTHGDTYLVKYAPAPLLRLAGLEASRPPITDVGMADPYLDVVRPIFSQRCFSCHNDDKQRGGLNLSKYETVMKGGKDGAIIVAGVLEKSDLYRRITLPPDEKDAMPAEGKTPLTEQQKAIIRWWIQSGARTGTTLARLSVPQEARTLIAAQLGLGGAPADSAAGASAAEANAAPKSADPALVAKLRAAGFAVQQRSLSDPSLIIRPGSFGSALTDPQIAQLAAAPDPIVELSLQRAGVGDGALGSVSKLTHLTHLRLDNNRISDAGLAKLKGALPQLEYLNLYGNSAITDASVDLLASLKSLTELYLWQTGMTPAGINRLRQLRPQLRIDAGSEDQGSVKVVKR